jgi:voltage-gated potassium channel
MYLILKLLARKITEVRFRTIFGLALLHLVLTYFGFTYLGEADLTVSFISYAYYYTVTASTIGYGDMSPSSEYGQLFATLFLIPVAVSIFAALITKAIATMTNEIQKIKSGYGDFHKTKNHTLIVGCNPKQTDKLLREIDKSEVIVVTSSDCRPSDQSVHIVRTESLASIDNLIRAGIKGAKRIVVMGKDDQETLLASLAVTSLVDENRHVVAYFDSQTTADILEANCKNVEAVTDNSVAQLARSLDDPGASHVIGNLVSATDPVSLRSTPLNNTNKHNIWYVKHLSEALLRLNATLIGYGSKEKPTMILRGDDVVPDDAIIYYIAEKDIDIHAVLV